MNRQIANRFINQVVAVGVENFYDKNKLFYYFGTVIDVSDTHLILENKLTIKELSFEQIREIKHDRRE
jgi:hypothetical protein